MNLQPTYLPGGVGLAVQNVGGPFGAWIDIADETPGGVPPVLLEDKLSFL
jgi:hypothetical protein